MILPAPDIAAAATVRKTMDVLIST